MPPSSDTLAPHSPPALGELTPPARRAGDQAAVFRRLRYRLVRNGLRVALESGKIRFFTMLGTSAFVAAFVFALGLYGFNELFQYRIPVKGLIVGGLFDLMFFTLGVMLVFSTGIILYASLFTSPESRYLLTTPARADRIFAAKFQAAVAFSSWAFLILGLPILVAYGIVAGVPWYYYPLLPAYLLGFVLLPGSLSALICLLLVRFLPRNRKQALVAIGLALVLLGGAWVVRTAVAARQTLLTNKRNELEGLIGQFQLVQHPLTPSHWMTTGIMAAARGEPADAADRLALIWSNGLLAYLVAAWASGRLYRTAFDRVAGGGRAKRVYRSSWLDRVMGVLVFYLDKPTRVLIVKDFRTFRRDPTQWVLLIIFGGLLLLGAMNTRQYYRNDLPVLDKYGLSLINLSATSVLLCAGLSRFIFPLISLEGRKFWILGLLPVRREQILFGKFAFAATGSVLAAETLILLSDVLIGMPWQAVAVHAATVAVVAVGLSALNVGLGATMPNFRETDPSKIVVGFGGTVNMVVGLLYLVVVVTVMSAPVHLAGLQQWLGTSPRGGDLPAWVFAGVPFGLAIGAAAVILPLRAGARALRATEF
jgi:ABC-2 type transport system permease protein